MIPSVSKMIIRLFMESARRPWKSGAPTSSRPPNNTSENRSRGNSEQNEIRPQNRASEPAGAVRLVWQRLESSRWSRDTLARAERGPAAASQFQPPWEPELTQSVLAQSLRMTHVCNVYLRLRQLSMRFGNRHTRRCHCIIFSGCT